MTFKEFYEAVKVIAAERNSNARAEFGAWTGGGPRHDPALARWSVYDSEEQQTYLGDTAQLALLRYRTGNPRESLTDGLAEVSAVGAP